MYKTIFVTGTQEKGAPGRGRDRLPLFALLFTKRTQMNRIRLFTVHIYIKAFWLGKEAVGTATAVNTNK